MEKKKVQTLEAPKTGAEIQVLGAAEFLVARLEPRRKTCAEFVEELRAGHPVVVAASQRCHLVGQLKAAGVFARSQAVAGSSWVTFFPCEERSFKS